MEEYLAADCGGGETICPENPTVAGNAETKTFLRQT